MPMTMTWWGWMLLGLVLAALEMATPGGFFIIFFGIGAMAVGILELLGVPLSLPVQVLVFVAISIASLLAFRNPLKRRFAAGAPAGAIDSLVGETAQALENIPAGGLGKVELRGSAWSAQNIGTAHMQKGSRCLVERVDGLTLYVRS
jgi:membrane protein implicated in regulation of membrane protease activity